MLKSIKTFSPSGTRRVPQGIGVDVISIDPGIDHTYQTPGVKTGLGM